MSIKINFESIGTLKVIIYNILLLIGLVILPNLLISLYNKYNYGESIYIVQYIFLILSFLGCLVIIKFNNKLIKSNNIANRQSLFFFKGIAILLAIIALFVIGVLYFFRTPPGF